MTRPLLEIRGLRTYFRSEAGVAKAVDGVDLDIMPGEVLGLVGESGSGKSVTALSILRLVPDPPGHIAGGQILFRGRDLLRLSWDEVREVRGEVIWALIREHRVTHLNGAPTVVTTIMRAPEREELDYRIVITTAGAPPSPTTILTMEKLGFRVVHVYGLTETYGPHTVCQWQVGWEDEEPAVRARLLSRQGVAMVMADPIRVVDEQGRDVPRDGLTVGEIVMSGNNVMKGYFADPDATAAAFRGGVFHSGDLGVHHPDGYVELRDRAKDVVVSGGENISTIEVEQCVARHPAVLECAVVAIPDPKWGERPKAFVTLKADRQASEAEIIEFCKQHIAHFKAPAAVEFGELPKTSTGKVQKFVLRDREWKGRDKRIN